MATITRAVVCGVLALLLGTGAYAASSADKCEAAKVKIATKYSSCLLKAQLKAVKNPAAEISGDLAKCDTTFTGKWAKAETKGGAACPTSGDAGSTQSFVTSFTGFLVHRFKPVLFTDNGDGTITDNRTGLMWEKKDGADGVANYGDPHDVDNFYKWSSTDNAPDGTVFTEFLAQLNNCGSDGTALVGGFAGHCDWRLPNLFELIQLINLGAGICGGGTGACIDPEFLPSKADVHWTSTADTEDPNNAWIVRFLVANPNQNTFVYPKGSNAFVRAVRGGS